MEKEKPTTIDVEKQKTTMDNGKTRKNREAYTPTMNMEKQKPTTIDEAIMLSKEGEEKPRLLLHTCCAPCASGVLSYIAEHFDITLFFYNPNIMPNEEFKLRLDTLKTLLLQYPSIKLIVPPQSISTFTSCVKGFEQCAEGGERCALCFNLRLFETANYVSQNRNLYDYFATTLSVSPHKNAELINKIGNDVASTLAVDYLSSDFKKKNGYLRSIQISKELNLYRQSYCGCKFI